MIISPIELRQSDIGFDVKLSEKLNEMHFQQSEVVVWALMDGFPVVWSCGAVEEEVQWKFDAYSIEDKFLFQHRIVFNQQLIFVHCLLDVLESLKQIFLNFPFFFNDLFISKVCIVLV